MGKISVTKLATVPEALIQSVRATKVQYRQLGDSGLKISNPILGGLQVGSSQWLPWVLDEEKVRSIYLLIGLY